MRAPLVLGIFGFAAVTLLGGFAKHPEFKATAPSAAQLVQADKKSQEMRHALTTCNRVFKLKSNVENAKQFLERCHSERLRKDCLQAAIDWTECVVELSEPDPRK